MICSVFLPPREPRMAKLKSHVFTADVIGSMVRLRLGLRATVDNNTKHHETGEQKGPSRGFRRRL